MWARAKETMGRVTAAVDAAAVSQDWAHPQVVALGISRSQFSISAGVPRRLTLSNSCACGVRGEVLACASTSPSFQPPPTLPELPGIVMRWLSVRTYPHRSAPRSRRLGTVRRSNDRCAIGLVRRSAERALGVGPPALRRQWSIVGLLLWRTTAPDRQFRCHTSSAKQVRVVTLVAAAIRGNQGEHQPHRSTGAEK